MWVSGLATRLIFWVLIEQRGFKSLHHNNNREYRIAAIAGGCNPSPSGSGVRVPLLPQKMKMCPNGCRCLVATQVMRVRVLSSSQNEGLAEWSKAMVCKTIQPWVRLPHPSQCFESRLVIL